MGELHAVVVPVAFGPAHEEVLGFALDGPLTVARAVFDWRIDLLFGSAAVLAVVIYLLAVRRRRRLGLHWRRRWTASWIAGAAVMLLATSSGVRWTRS